MTHVTATELGELLPPATGSFSRHGLAGFAEQGLSPARVRLFVVVGAAPGIRMRGCAPQLGVTDRAVTRLVDGLETGGLILRNPDPVDRRAFRPNLTAAGESLRAVIAELQEKVSDEAFSSLTRSDRDQLASLLRKRVDGWKPTSTTAERAGAPIRQRPRPIRRGVG
jgi:DNA-binding MarR family transcriptional regulator